MSRRRIGQEVLALPGSGQVGRGSTLDQLATLIDWAPVEVHLKDVSAAAKGEPAWPPLALFRALLIAVWYDLSDVKLAEALDDRASFRRFCGFAAHEPVPERTSFVRFRMALLARGLDTVLFDEVTGQLRAQAVRVETGTLVDATVIPSATKGDGEAAWAGHRSRKAVHGYKAHVGDDADTALVEIVAVTPGNVNDGRAGPSALPEVVDEVFADSAYRGPHFAAAVQARGGVPRIVATYVWCDKDADGPALLRTINGPIQRVRGRIEKIFGTRKRSYGLRRMRWRGLAKAGLQVRLTAIAYNLRRTMTILQDKCA